MCPTANGRSMANACFRCRTSIPSGGTFCRQCQSTVSLAGTVSETTPGWWRMVAVGTVVTTVYLTIAFLSGIAGVEINPLLTGAVLGIGVAGFFAGFYLDTRAVRGRSDLDVSLSNWYVGAATFLSLFVVPIPLVGAHYLYRRRQRIGLST